MNKKEVWLLIIVPGLCHFLFHGMWVDFFLLALFYISFRTKVFPYFYFVFIWGILYSIATIDDPGREILALGTTWYFLASFRFETDISKFISATAGSVIYAITKFCIGFGGCVWNIPVTIVFIIYFVLIHTAITTCFIVLVYNFSRNRLKTV
ncbi:MAG: hypothetical protein N2115_04995 [bacterium]|nr:hypothetical protein [bacterium]